MDFPWSLLSVVSTLTSLNSSMNSTWSLIGTGASHLSSNFSINSTWSLLGTAGSQPSLNISTSASGIQDSTWSSTPQMSFETSLTSSWTASFTTITVSGAVSSIDLSSSDVTSMPVTVNMAESTPYARSWGYMMEKQVLSTLVSGSC